LLIVTAEPSDAGSVGPGNGRLVNGGRTTALEWGLCSDAGPSRDHNEDFAGAHAGTDEAPDAHPPIFVVADGLGGHDAGEVASRVAVDAVMTSWAAAKGDPAKALRAAARIANTAVVDEGITSGHPGMGTTLTALTVTGAELFIAHIGDSRVYRHRGDSCVQLTTDHSRVGEMVRMKLITAEQAARHPARSQLTRSLGAGLVVQIDLVRDRVEVGDTFILCTDGLWDEVGNAEIASLFAADRQTSRLDAADRLVALAIERGSADNVTAVVVTVLSALPEKPASDKRSLFRRRG
jgi:PPM family protein phosphatase